MPSVSKEGDIVEYEITSSIKKVMDYSNLNWNETLDLKCDLFKLMLKNAIVDDLNKSEEGRKYLDDCKRLNTTSMDIEALEKKFDLGGEEK